MVAHRLAPILWTAAAVRLAFPVIAIVLHQFGTWPYLEDSREYVRLGQHLFESGTFTTAGSPEVFRVPGYPLLLAAATAAGHRTVAAIAVQIALGVATVALVYGIAREGGGDRLARTAAWIAAVDPALAQYCSHLMPDTLFTALVAATCFAWVRMPPESSWWPTLVGGFASIAALVRPVGYFLPVVAAVAALAMRRQGSWRVRLRTSLIMLGVYAAIVGGWHVRNVTVAGYNGFSTQMDRQMYLTTGVWMTARAEHRPFGDVRAEFFADIKAATGATDDSGPVFAAEARRRGAAFLREHWWVALRLQAVGSLVTLLKPPGSEFRTLFARTEPSGDRLLWFALTHWPTETWRRLPPGRAWLIWQSVYAAYWAVFLVLASIGAVALGRQRAVRTRLAFGGAMGAYLLAASGGYFADARFRLPLIPLLCIVAAVGLLWLRDRGWRWRRAPVYGSGVRSGDGLNA